MSARANHKISARANEKIEAAPMPGPGPEPSECLGPTYFFDYESPALQAFLAAHVDPALDAFENAIRLYYAVRDGLRYNPYKLDVARESFRLSHLVGLKQSYCIPKAMLYAGVCRALGFPARLGFGDVKNHLSSQQLIDYLGTDLFAFHGYAEIFLNGRWVQATPAFDQRLCAKFGVAPLDFDGTTDSLFQEFDGEGRKFMQYVRYHGCFADLPYEWLMDGMAKAYPRVFAGVRPRRDGDLMLEV